MTLDYIRIEADVLSRQDLSDKAKMLLGLIKSFNCKGLTLSNPELAKSLGTSERTIARSIGELEEKKLITITGAQSRHRKIYSAKSDRVEPSYSAKDGQVETPLLGQKWYSTRPKMSNITKRTKESITKPLLKDTFETFWNAYPRKKARQEALKAFKKLNIDDALLDTLLKAIDRQKQSDDWQKDGGRYIPYPATWLKGRRWEDEPPDGMDGLTREIDESELKHLLGDMDDD